MFVTYGEYKRMGYSEAGKDEFKRLSNMAERAVARYTFGRVDKGNITAENKRGVCELIGAFKRITAVAGVTGFSNEGYSESFAANGGKERIPEIMGSYFTAEQLYRGMM